MKPKPIHSEGGKKTFALVFGVVEKLRAEEQELPLVGDVASLEGGPRLCARGAAVVLAPQPLRTRSQLTTSLERVVTQCVLGPIA